jgi:Bacterial SH3 domain
MKINYFPITKAVMVLVISTLIGWAHSGYAIKQWDARATARVNLRTNPGPNGLILSIIPQGHRIRVLEKKGLWCRVDVEGDIHGKGWVYGKYVEEIIPEMPATDSVPQPKKVETVSEDQSIEIHSAEPLPKEWMEPAEIKPLRTDMNEAVSEQTQLRKPKTTTDVMAGKEVAETEKPTHIAISQTPPVIATEDKKTALKNESLPANIAKPAKKKQPVVRHELQNTQNEPDVTSQVRVSRVGEPVQMPPARKLNSGSEQDASGFKQTSSSGKIEQSYTALQQKTLPGGDKKQNQATQKAQSQTIENALTDIRSVRASALGSAASPEGKKLKNQQVSMGLFEVTLKLLSIVLSCLVIFLLHRSNKLATSRHHALIQFKRVLDRHQQG